MSDDYCELTGNAGEEHICFCSDLVLCLSSGDAHIDLKVIDRTFYDGPNLIKNNPFIGISLNSGKFAGTSFFCGVARIFAVADILPFYYMDFGTALSFS